MAQLGGTFALGKFKVQRLGYGAMQLAGPHVWGPPRDEDAAIRVLREAVELGVDHIDTSDFYGPEITNVLIRRALHPYADQLTIVTKVGFKRGPNKEWLPASSRDELVEQVLGNLRNLGLDALHVVNLRVAGPGSIAERLKVLIELKEKGEIRELGLSNVSAEQVAEARALTSIVCVQNEYNLAQRKDDALIERLAADEIAYVPYFPLGGFSPLQSRELNAVAGSLNATPMQVALAWLLHRSPNVLCIPGTSSVAHLRENLAAAAIDLRAEAITKLDAIGVRT
ncbi:MAG TPA: oxidoreductase [Polyangiales bacterium]|nr:oxidoreductase [Polyangiales bacterium]